MDELLDNCIINSEKLKDVIISPEQSSWVKIEFNQNHELEFRSIQSIIIL